MLMKKAAKTADVAESVTSYARPNVTRVDKTPNTAGTNTQTCKRREDGQKRTERE